MELSRYKTLLQREIESATTIIMNLPAAGPPGTLSLEEILLRSVQDEPTHRAAVDTAAVYWAEHRAWRPAEAVVAKYFLLRLNSAHRFLESVEALSLITDAPESQVLSWLLVDHWRIAGRAQWLLRWINPQEPNE